MKKFKRNLISLLSLPLPLLAALVALLPFRLLYLFSSVLFFLLYHVFGYRQKVVMQNLRNSFPEKQDADLQQIARGFYSHMADITFEAFKALLATEASLKKRIRFTHQAKALIDTFYTGKKSIIVVMGHYGNWEWIGPGFNLVYPSYLHTAYKPLKNVVMGWLIRKIRTRFGHVLVPSEQVARHLINLENNHETKAFAMVADQAPSPATAWWFPFLNQDTPFFTGAEKLARKFNRPVVFCSLQKQKRGYYLIHAQLIAQNPAELPPQAITREYARLLEEQIRLAPQYWLWSHRRWKHRRK